MGGPVNRNRTLYDELLKCLGLLAGGEQLHRADDVDLLHRRAAAGSTWCRDHREMYDGVDATCTDHLRDNGIADVGAYEIGGAEVVPRRDHIDPDDLNMCLSGKRAGEAGT